MRFENKAIVFYSIFIGLFVIGLMTFHIEFSRRKTLSSIQTNLENIGKTTEISINAAIEMIDLTLLHFAKDVQRNPNLLRTNLWPKLEDIRNSFHNYERTAVRITNAKGDIIHATAIGGSSQRASSFASRDFFLHFKEGNDQRLFIGEPVRAIVDGRWVINFAHRLENKQSEFLGVIVVALEPSFFDAYISAVGATKDDIISIATGEKMYRSNRYPIEANAKIGGPIEIGASLFEVREGKVHSKYAIFPSVIDGISRAWFATRIGSYPIMINIGRELSSRMGAWYLQVGLESFVVVIFLVVEFFFVRIFLKNSRRIREQIANLAHSSKLVALGEMAGSIGHEINNPMAVIKLSAEHMREELNLSIPNHKMVTMKLDKILLMSDRISRIIIGLRKFARQEPCLLKPVDVKYIIGESLDICSERFRQNSVTLRFVHEGTTRLVDADEVQIMQVMINLLNNAFDAVANSLDPWVKIELKYTEKNAVIWVTDSGKGIPIEITDKIMHPFFTTKELGKGTGLGLSVSKGIIDKHGGKLYYDKNSENTRFVVEIPLKCGVSY